MIDDETQGYALCQTSIAHTFGNVVAQVQNYLINLFPENTFSTIHINSKLAHRQLTGTSQKFLKKKCPMFIMRPRVDWTDTDKFLYHTMITERMTDLRHSYNNGALMPFIADPKAKYKVEWQLNRHVINFDVTLMFDTYIEHMNYMNYLMNATRIGHPFFIETCLESYIPKEMMELISQCAGVPLYDEKGSVKHFLDYINGVSNFPITYKLKGSSNTDEFFRYYRANIDTTITQLSGDDGTKVGQINGRHDIQFSVRCEFNSTGFYYIFSDKIKEVKNIPVTDGGTLIPIFTDVIVHEDLHLNDGWKIIASPSCRLDKQEDEVSIDEILNRSVQVALDYHLEHGMDPRLFFALKIRKQGTLLVEGVDYDFDFKTRTVHFHNGSTYYTYKIIVAVNIQYLNDLIRDIYNLE